MRPTLIRCHENSKSATTVPTGEATRIRNLDSNARWFQERMIQAILLLPKRGRHPHEGKHIGEVKLSKQPHITQRVVRAKILKHEVFCRGRMLECLRCGQFWESTASSYIFSEQICPGPRIYGPALEHTRFSRPHMVGQVQIAQVASICVV